MVDAQVRKDIKDAFFRGELTVEAVSSDGAVGWFPIGDVMKHEVSHKPAVRVTLEDGQAVTVTEDHSLFVGLRPTQAFDLEPGSSLTLVLDGTVTAATVASLEEQPGQVMFDLCVPGPQNFVLTNGVLAHNSYSIGGVSLDIEKSSRYESAYSAMKDSFESQIERAKQTVKSIRGLKQYRYGVGIRSSFGPYTGSGVLTPKKFSGGF